MNNIQLYLSIGIPAFAVILAWRSRRSDIHHLNEKIDRVEKSLNDKIDKLGDSLLAEMIAFRRKVHADLILLHELVVKLKRSKIDSDLTKEGCRPKDLNRIGDKVDKLGDSFRADLNAYVSPAAKAKF